MKLLALLFLITAFTANAQQARKVTCVEGLPSTEADYKRWLNRDAKYIVTEPERNAFLKLSTNDEREQFIENFWLRRDPTPDTEENEYRDEYYTRIAYANEHFQSGIAGWQTDRGRIYIMHGKPDAIESGVTLDAGRNSVPYEKWSYKDVSVPRYTLWPEPRVVQPKSFIFVDPTQSDEFRLIKAEERKQYPQI
jgi:GWxTD domain-containing protein